MPSSRRGLGLNRSGGVRSGGNEQPHDWEKGEHRRRYRTGGCPIIGAVVHIPRYTGWVPLLLLLQ